MNIPSLQTISVAAGRLAGRYPSFGDAHFYILTADAAPLDGISVNGMTVERLTGVLEKTVRTLALKPGGPMVKPRPQSVPLLGFIQFDPAAERHSKVAPGHDEGHL
jgi:hypothetical protein